LSIFLPKLIQQVFKTYLGVITISLAVSITQPVIAQSRPQKADPTELITRGKKLWDAQDITGALEAYTQAALVKPRNARIQASIGFLLTQQQRFPEAIAAFQRATSLDRKDPKPLIALGFVYTQQQQYSQALTAYRRAIRLDPRNIDAYLSIGYVLTQQNDVFGATAVYRQLIKLLPNSIRGYLNLGYLLQKKGNLDGAVIAYRDASRIDPNNVDVLVALASASKNNSQESIEIYQKILALNPRHVKANLELAQFARNQGSFDEAISLYRRAASGEIDTNTSVQIQKAIAAVYLRQNNISGAIVAYRDILSINSEDGSAHFALGKLLLEQGRKPEAIESLKQSERIFASKGDTKSLAEVRKLLDRN